MRRLRATIAVLPLVALVACESPLPDAESYYDRRIAPTLAVGCQMTTSGCHVADERGSAPGNLDLSSYDSLRRRYDLLIPYGPYSRPLFLLKASAQETIHVEVHDPPDPSQPEVRTIAIETDIRHAGGFGMRPGSGGLGEIQRWLAEGFDRHGVPREDTRENSGECSPGPGFAAGFSRAEEPNAALFGAFVDDVQPVLRASCAGGDCHGSPLADYHLACGDTDEERRWNYWISTRFLGDPVGRSELLRKPLAVARGGSFHTGGDTFASDDDAGYRALATWADEVVRTDPSLVREGDPSEGYRFFLNRVQPVLVRKGCMSLACHSPLSVVFHLRGGSQGAFSRLSREINYAEARKFLALESDDPNQSRLIGKNLHAFEVGEGHGILHRGGSLFEDFAWPADARVCEGVDADAGDLNEIPAYCVMRRWHAIERAARVASGELSADVRALVWVDRPLGVGSFTDFDTYRPGADLRYAEASLASGALELTEEPRSLLALCGLDAASADVRRPRPSWDGRRFAFAARSAASRPLRLYEIEPAAGTCRPLPGAATEESRDGVLVHDLDPAYAPDGTIVFASTRGLAQGRPTRTRAALEPNADLYVLDPETSAVRQLTFILDQELAPGFLPNGQVTYTGEKRELDFHTLALRRINLDGGDFHPLYASRPSLGFGLAHDVSTLPNGNGVFLASEWGAVDATGSIFTFNRSLGPDQEGRREPGYLSSLARILPSALHGGRGLYRSPHPLPSGEVLLACAPDATPDALAVDLDLCVLTPETGALRTVLTAPGRALVDGIALYGRPNRGVLRSDGSGIERPVIEVGPTDAIVQINDYPMIQSLMFENTREGRPIDFRIGGFEILAQQPPPVGMTSLEGANVVEDSLGRFYSSSERLGWVPLFADGSVTVRLPGGIPISFLMTDARGGLLEMAPDAPFVGPARQREHEQYYPGERIKRSIPRRFFNTACGGCHGSVTGRELDIAVDVDIVTGASRTLAREAEPYDLMR